MLLCLKEPSSLLKGIFLPLVRVSRRSDQSYREISVPENVEIVIICIKHDLVENEQMDKLSSLPSLNETKDEGAVDGSKKYSTRHSYSRRRGEMISSISLKQR